MLFGKTHWGNGALSATPAAPRHGFHNLIQVHQELEFKDSRQIFHPVSHPVLVFGLGLGPWSHPEARAVGGSPTFATGGGQPTQVIANQPRHFKGLHQKWFVAREFCVDLILEHFAFAGNPWRSLGRQLPA